MEEGAQNKLEELVWFASGRFEERISLDMLQGGSLCSICHFKA